MHVVVVDWLSVKEAVADELDKQLRVEKTTIVLDNLRHCDKLNL